MEENLDFNQISNSDKTSREEIIGLNRLFNKGEIKEIFLKKNISSNFLEGFYGKVCKKI